jgi:hypothetical protein
VPRGRDIVELIASRQHKETGIVVCRAFGPRCVRTAEALELNQAPILLGRFRLLKHRWLNDLDEGEAAGRVASDLAADVVPALQPL